MMRTRQFKRCGAKMDNRFYFEKQQGENIIFIEQEAKHINLVRRAVVGDKVVGFNGDGYDYFATITQISKQQVAAKITSKTLNPAHTEKHTAVFLAMIKNDALTDAIDHLAELNVSEVFLFKADRSVAILDNKKLEKLSAISLQASKQCERADVMKVSIIDKSEIKAKAQQFNNIFFAYENASEGIKNFVGDYAVILGPEGGFSEQEVKYFSSFAKTISLSKTILRAPVAALVAVSKLNAKSE